MKDILSQLADLRRPQLLIQAARFGVADYKRETSLVRLLDHETIPRSGEALMLLMELENWLEEQRRTGEAGYAPSRHVEVMIAVLGEARLLRNSQQYTVTPPVRIVAAAESVPDWVPSRVVPAASTEGPSLR